MSTAIQVVTTAVDQEEAERIAEFLVSERLAGCAQISGPVTSIFRWEGKLDTTKEWRLTIKTYMDRYAEVEAAIRRLHSYDEPEILAMPVIAGSEGYLRWLADSVDVSV
jgi:periplasmic divalent cation tolerance protein